MVPPRDKAVVDTEGKRPGFLPSGATDWLQFLSILVGGALAGLAAISSVFFQYFGVTLEESGHGPGTGGAFVVLGIVALGTALYFVIFYPFARALSNGWLSLKDQTNQLASRGRGHVTLFYAFWALLPCSLVLFVLVLPTADQETIQIGNVTIRGGTVLVLLALAVWFLLYRIHNRWLRIEPSERDPEELKRIEKSLRFGAVGVAVTFQIVLLMVLSISNAARVRDGHAAQGWLYQVVPVTVVPLMAVPATLTDSLSHCLMYFGHANGVTVLYDADTDSILRLPTSALLVRASIKTEPPSNSACA